MLIAESVLDVIGCRKPLRNAPIRFGGKVLVAGQSFRAGEIPIPGYISYLAEHLRLLVQIKTHTPTFSPKFNFFVFHQYTSSEGERRVDILRIIILNHYISLV